MKVGDSSMELDGSDEEQISGRSSMRSRTRSQASQKRSKSIDKNDDLLKQISCLLDEKLAPTNTKIDKLNTQMDKWEARIKNVESRTTRVEADIKRITKYYDMLEDKMQRMEEYSRSYNVLLFGIPEMDGETGSHIISRIESVLKIGLKDNHIANCHRLKSRNRNSPPPFIIKFVNQNMKNLLISKLKSSESGITAELFGGSREVRIKISEQLTASKVDLFNQAKELYKIGYKYVWCKGGKIFAKEGDTTAAILISNRETLDKLFK